HQITLNVVTTATAAGIALNVSGGGTITISQNATATATLVALTIAGGTQAAPLWGAGDMNTHSLADVPVAVAQFAGRAWYAVDAGVVFSDSLDPLQQTNASQAITFGNDLDVTALAGLPLSSTTQGGIIQSLIAFQGDGQMWQITGDQATNNLVKNA